MSAREPASQKQLMSNPADEKSEELDRRQANVSASSHAVQENVDYARGLLNSAERVSREYARVMFGKRDPRDIVASASMERRREVYQMLKPYCSEEDLAILNADSASPQQNSSLVKRLRTKSFI